MNSMSIGTESELKVREYPMFQEEPFPSSCNSWLHSTRVHDLQSLDGKLKKEKEIHTYLLPFNTL